MEQPKSKMQLELDRRAEERLAAYERELEEARLRLQRIEERLRPVADLLNSRRKELGTWQAVIKNATMASDPAAVAEAMRMAPAFEKIIELAEREYRSIDATRQFAQNDFVNIKRSLTNIKRSLTQ